MREEEPPEDLESRMHRQHAQHAKAMEKALKPKRWMKCSKSST
jgi:hypothetical protein